MTYSDVAIAPPERDEFEKLELYHATSGGEAALARKRRDDSDSRRLAGGRGDALKRGSRSSSQVPHRRPVRNSR